MAEDVCLSDEAIQERALHFARGCPETQEKLKSKRWLNGFRNNISPSQHCESPQHGLVTGSAWPPPTPYQALQALRMVINYAEPRLELPQDANILMLLGMIVRNCIYHCSFVGGRAPAAMPTIYW